MVSNMFSSNILQMGWRHQLDHVIFVFFEPTIRFWTFFKNHCHAVVESLLNGTSLMRQKYSRWVKRHDGLCGKSLKGWQFCWWPFWDCLSDPFKRRIVTSKRSGAGVYTLRIRLYVLRTGFPRTNPMTWGWDLDHQSYLIGMGLDS